jgi:hypothetical protein
MQRNVMQLFKTIVVQHFKLLKGLHLSCSFLSSGQHAYHHHHDKVAAIMVKLFDQTLLADVEMIYIKYTVFGVLDEALLMDSTHQSPSTSCSIALAAAYLLAIAYRMQQHLFAVQPVIYALKHKPLSCGVPGDRMQ